MPEIHILKVAKAIAVEDINRLLEQLRTDGDESRGTISELQEIVKDKNISVVTLQDKGHIVGIGTLYVMTKFGKKTSHIEDVVVDNAYRGQGLGEKLVRALIEEARRRELTSVSLTSRPSRIAANKLYLKVGFQTKETNVYRLKL